jgi:hypothetical protein
MQGHYELQRDVREGGGIGQEPEGKNEESQEFSSVVSNTAIFQQSGLFESELLVTVDASEPWKWLGGHRVANAL